MSKKINIINDSLHGIVELTRLEKVIINHIIFNRLHDIYQNSTAYLTFPSNRTKRFEHSIGVMYLSSQMFGCSLQNTDGSVIEEIFTIAKKSISEIFKGLNSDSSNGQYFGNKAIKFEIDDFLKHDFNFENYEQNLLPNNLVFDQEHMNIFMILMQSIRVAGLLHDIGHPPYSHIVERALNNIYLNLKNHENSLNDKEMNFFEIAKKFFEKKDENRQPHEIIGDDLAEIIIQSALYILSDVDLELIYHNVYVLIIKKIVLEMYNASFQNFREEKKFSDEINSFFNFLHSYVAGAFDGDRLDYVARDLMNSGLCGEIEYKRIFSQMKIFSHQITISGKETFKIYYFAIHEKTRNSVEDFLKKRLKLYKDVLFHHRVQKTDFLLSNCVERVIKEYFEEKDKVSSDTENGLKEITKLWEPFEKNFLKDKEDSLTQWNDSWLLTILKKIYLEYYDINKGLTGKEIIKNQLEELLKNKKRYYSLIKRKNEYDIMDQAAKNSFFSSKEEFEKYYKKIDSFRTRHKQSRSKLPVKIKETLEKIETEPDFINQMKSLELPLLSRQKYSVFLKNIVENQFKEKYKDDFYDVIFIMKKLSSGIGEKNSISNTDFNYNTIFFYNDDKNETYTIQEQGNQFIDLLNLEILNSPSIYIYINPRIEQNSFAIKKKDYLENIGKIIGESLSKIVISKLAQFAK